MDTASTVCPVCTLFLRPGITLKQHLTSHPKQKVIEALVKLSSSQEEPKVQTIPLQPNVNVTCNPPVNSTVSSQPWNHPQVLPHPSNVNSIHGNHFFIYQQSMSTTSPQSNVLNVNPLSQHYVYPAVFNSLPYVYQQQQVIMSSNSLPAPMRALPFDLSQSGNDKNGVVTDNVDMNCDKKIVEISETSIEQKQEEAEVIQEENVKKHDLTEDIQPVPVFENHRAFLNEVPPEYDAFTTNSQSAEPADQQSGEDNVADSPKSNLEWRFQSELNKACQTQTNNISPRSQAEEEEGVRENYTGDQPEYLYISNDAETGQFQQNSNNYHDSSPFTKNFENYEQSDPIYTSANILHGSDHLDLVNVDDIVLINNYQEQVVSPVENFGSSSSDRPGVLMTIGDISQKMEFNEHRDPDESTSSSHVNIKSDERMPPRGELSGQESIDGASDITWNRLQYYEGSSKMLNNYSLIGHDSWENSDSDTVETPPAKEEMPELTPFYEEQIDDKVKEDLVEFSGPNLNFKCSTCNECFINFKDKREHEEKQHPETIKCNLIGAEIGKRKAKKIVVKLKSDKTENENNFDNVFSRQLKFETTENLPPDDFKESIDLDDGIKDVKTICTICDCILENTKALKIHKMEKHKETPLLRHKCQTCGETFPNEYKFTVHLKIHPLECRMCGKLFYRKQNFQLHMKRHLGLKPYKCDICEKAFVTRQKLEEHRNIHTGESPLKCNMCDEKFRRHSNLVQHRNRHHLQIKRKVRDYVCHCGEVFHSKKKLAWHKEIHDPKPKACTQCSEKFQHMSSLTRHMRRAHNQKYLPEETRQGENVECPICKGTYLKSSLDVHIRNHSGQRPFTCLICNKDFTTKWNLKLHKWTHASRTAKPFKCDQCKGAFIRETDYIAHMNSHKSVRPYTCNYCGAQFIRKYNCLRHVKEHENDKTFNCTVCGKSFHRSYYLKDHMRVHSGVRPFICHICGKTSTTKSNHNKHTMIHHAREPVTTEN